jgi:hypothetical protein
MNIFGLLQLGFSLVAVMGMVGFAKWLGLGAEVRIQGEVQAKQIAYDHLNGFTATDAIVDKAGYAALVKDAENQHVLIRTHGTHFVTRMVYPPIEGRLDQKFLTIDLQEPDFAPVTLNLGDAAQYWASGLRHIPNG